MVVEKAKGKTAWLKIQSAALMANYKHAKALPQYR
jgi:hypothetical protein